MPKNEIHIQLYVDYAEDDKIIPVSRSARLLYVDAICMAKRALTDGVLTHSQLVRLAYPERPSTARKLISELVDSGALATTSELKVYRICGYLKRNRSKSDLKVSQQLATEKALRANHVRWHTEEGRYVPTCENCLKDHPNGDPNGDRVGDPNGDRVGDPTMESTETETETETKNKNPPLPPEPSKPRAVRRPAARTAAPPETDIDFDRFYDVYPRQTHRVTAAKAWAAALKKGVSADTIIEGAKRFADERRGEDQRFTPHPATWINNQRWTDAPLIPIRPAGQKEMWWDV